MGGRRHAGPAACGLLLAAIAGCYGDNKLRPEEQEPTRIVIEPDTAVLTFIDETRSFGAKVFDQLDDRMPQAVVTWSTSDTLLFSLAQATGGVTLTALANGTGSLRATSEKISTSASVTVWQSAGGMEIASGNEQEGIRGEALPAPLAVLVKDPGGTPAAGVAVTFRPSERSGAVADSVAHTGADGIASADWTLGDRREQSVTVSAGGFEAVFTATAFSDPPVPDYALVGELEPARYDPLDTDTLEIRVRIANLGDGTGPATFPVGVSVDGAPSQPARVDRIAPGDTATVSLRTGPMQAGGRTIGVEIDPEGVIEEWEESNNADSVKVRVVRQREISLGEAVTVQSSEIDEVFLFRVEIAEPSGEALNVELSGGTGDADLFGHYGERPDYRYRYRCFSIGGETDEHCQMVPTRAGTYHFAVHAFTAFGPSTLRVAVGGKPVEPFDIELVFLKGGTEEQDDAVKDAAERWESVIARDVFDWDHDAYGRVPAGTCGPGSPAVSDLVDDIRIFVTVDSIDGSGGVAARSGPCWVRPYPLEGGEGIWLQPTLAALVLDEDDVAEIEEEDLLDAFVTHEMAHALGFAPGLWDRHGLLRDPSLPDDSAADTHFDGPRAIAAFDAVGGGGYGGAKVPLESGAKPGISDSHWRASVFEDELMTPYLTGDSQPLSLVTVESFYDIGYEVNLTEADSFSLSLEQKREKRPGRTRIFHLRNDVGAIPVRLLRTGPRGVK